VGIDGACADKRIAHALVEQVASNVRAHVHDVLSSSHLLEQWSERYLRLVDAGLRDFGV